ncbi:hypothetical protein GCM10010116_40840 [Microbispora rosea subsp. aerata]|nr:hypothetical protein GCM10010116_40840 [Microbispora rosea subsp. aerata]
MTRYVSSDEIGAGERGIEAVGGIEAFRWAPRWLRDRITLRLGAAVGSPCPPGRRVVRGNPV